MDETTPDIRQLSDCCGKPLKWVEDWGRMVADCSACDSYVTDAEDGNKPERTLTATEDLLLARIAEFEAAQRWRVTAEVSPHEGEQVLGLRGGEPEVMTYAEEGLDHPYLWFTANDSGVDAPEYWMPIPAAPVTISPGADVPKEQ